MTNEQKVEGKCNATTRDGNYCANPPVDGRERCRMHGGTRKRGTEHPNAVHGLRSDFLSDEDEEIYDEVREFDNVELMQEELWMVKTKLLRAAREANGSEGLQFAQQTLDKIEDGEADDDVVRGLAKIIQVSETSVDRAIGRLIDLSDQIHKQTEGDTVNVEAGEEWRKMLAGDDE